MKLRNKGCEGIYKILLQLVPINVFDKFQLKELLNKVRSQTFLTPIATQLDSVIIAFRYEFLSNQVKKVNVEINQDAKAVSEKISTLGFQKNYNELLAGIDIHRHRTI